MSRTQPPLLEEVRSYYESKLSAHSATPRGVDWNSRESQLLRFTKLFGVMESGEVGESGEAGGNFSVLDYGCGYGALVPELKRLAPGATYQGYDISPKMIEAARAAFGGEPSTTFTADSNELRPCDFVLASGIFNVKQGRTVPEWEEYVADTLAELNRLARRGFAFNMLTSYSDAHKRRDDLFYGDPRFYFDLCKAKFGLGVTLVHDYALYEFTIWARKS